MAYVVSLKAEERPERKRELVDIIFPHGIHRDKLFHGLIPICGNPHYVVPGWSYNSLPASAAERVRLVEQEIDVALSRSADAEKLAESICDLLDRDYELGNHNLRSKLPNSEFIYHCGDIPPISSSVVAGRVRKIDVPVTNYVYAIFKDLLPEPKGMRKVQRKLSEALDEGGYFKNHIHSSERIGLIENAKINVIEYLESLVPRDILNRASYGVLYPNIEVSLVGIAPSKNPQNKNDMPEQGLLVDTLIAIEEEILKKKDLACTLRSDGRESPPRLSFFW